MEKRPVQNAFVNVRIRPWLSIKAGRFKPDFGFDFSRGNNDLLIVDRSRLSSFLKDEEGGTRLYGLEPQQRD
jgi:hypothetical protein